MTITKNRRTPKINKKIPRIFTAFCAALMLMGGVSVTAFAQVPEKATDDSGVIYKDSKKEEPLTPDGNAILVDETKSIMGGLILFLIVALLDSGSAFYYFKFMKSKQSVKGSTDLEDFDFEDCDEDEPEPDDTDGDASEDESDNEM